MLTSPAVFAQPQPAGQPNDEGIYSYLFSPRAVTVVLVLILIAQLVYRHRVRHASPSAPVMYDHAAASPHSSQTAKKRYDRDEISKLLKASATSKNSGRSLEEAIRLSQAVQDNLLGSIHPRFEAEEGVAPVVDAESHSVEFEPRSVEGDSEQKTQVSK